MARYRARPRTDAWERFCAKVDVPSTVTEDTCFEWKAGTDRNGYGQLTMPTGGKKRTVRAHRFAWVRANGEIPEGLYVCHRCDNPRCVRVEHLFLGTSAENAADRDAKGRGCKGDDHPWQRSRDEMLRKIKGKITPPVRRGRDNPSAKLTQSQVLEIRSDPRPDRTLAPIYGISRSLIGAIRRREVWAHIENVTEVL